MQSVDVAIVGGGMVGLAVACGLQGSGLRVAVLEQRVPGTSGGGCTTTTARFGYQCRQRKITDSSWRLAGDSLPQSQLLSRYGSVGQRQFWSHLV